MYERASSHDGDHGWLPTRYRDAGLDSCAVVSRRARPARHVSATITGLSTTEEQLKASDRSLKAAIGHAEDALTSPQETEVEHVMTGAASTVAAVEQAMRTNETALAKVAEYLRNIETSAANMTAAGTTTSSATPRTSQPSTAGTGTAKQWFPEGTDKIPAIWGEPKPNKKGVGYRWSGGQAQGVRIDQGHPSSPSPSQRVDHVIVRDGGLVIGRDGNPNEGSQSRTIRSTPKSR